MDCYLPSLDFLLKGTVSQDFLLQIFASQGAPPRPPVSMPPVANHLFIRIFAPVATGIINPGNKFVTGVNDTGSK